MISHGIALLWFYDVFGYIHWILTNINKKPFYIPTRDPTMMGEGSMTKSDKDEMERTMLADLSLGSTALKVSS